MRRLLVAALLALPLLAAFPHAASARTRLDARIDALTTTQLLTGNAVLLVDPARQRRARALADLRHVAAGGWGVSQIIAFWWLWRSGTGARLRDMLRRCTRRRAVQRLVFGAVLGALTAVASFPFALMGYRVAFSGGLTFEPLGTWFLAYLGRVVLDAAVGAAIVAGVLTLVERTRLWYLVVIVVLYVAALGSVMLEPVFPLGTPQKTTPRVVAALGAMVAARVGVESPKPVVVTATSRRSNAMSMRASGIGPTRRVVIGDLDLVHFTPPELASVLSRGFVHVRFEDPLRQTLFGVTLFVLSAAIAVLMSDRVGFRRDDDALSRLALVGTFLGLVMVFTYPIYTAYARSIELRTDYDSLRAMADPAARVRAFVRLADVNLIPLCDRRSIRWYFDDRPPLGRRIALTNGTADPCPR
ncbi:MAG TPA: M48 family metalloprotease [Candidatus Acidoferrum sp.]|nr:M48 family metalloprotease [Candidatus Acidoferrum sp.]